MICPNCNSNLITLPDEKVCIRCGFSTNAKPKERRTSEATLGKVKQLKINRLAAQKMYSSLMKKNGGKHSDGMEYFLSRGLDKKIISRFGLGWGSAQLPFSLRDKGFTEDEMLLSGLVGKSQRSGRLYDKFYNRVIFPIFDVNNIVIGFGGRIITPSDSSPKYINSKESEVFKKRENLFALNFAKDSPLDYFILCEGFMDVIALHSAGFTNAIASLGTALTEEQVRLLKQYKSKVYIAYDSDEAGIKATMRAISVLQKQGLMDIKVISLGEYKDPDELIKALGWKSFLKRISQAQSAERFLYQKTKAKEDKTELLSNLLIAKRDK